MPGPRPPGGGGGHQGSRSTVSPTPIQCLLHHRSLGSCWPSSLMLAGAGRAGSRVYYRFRRIGSQRDGAEAGAPVLHVENGQPGRHRFIGTASQSYHGNTLGALAVGGNAARRVKPLSPCSLMPASHIAPCYAYRHQRTGGDVRRPTERRAAGELEAEIQRLGPESGRRLHRRAGGRRDGRRRAAGARLLRAHPRDLRSPRRAC